MARKMTVKDLSSFAELAPKTIYNLVYSNQIPFERISEKRVVFDEDKIREWLDQRKIESKIKRSGPRPRRKGRPPALQAQAPRPSAISGPVPIPRSPAVPRSVRPLDENGLA
jgi:predicted DNA-binding transcriptional regulator AlpA